MTSAAITAGATRFAQTIVITVNGSGLDSGVAVTSPLCTNATPSTAAPYVSTATTAYFQCAVSGVGSGQIVISRIADGAMLATVPVTVAQPKVTLAVDNGIGTSGSIVVTLAADKAPATVRNFLAYVNTGFYAGTLIHRVAPGFVVQGGGYTAPAAGSALPLPKTASAPLALETGGGLSNVQWAVAMARTSSVDSATSQFFIDLVDNSKGLDPGTVTGPGYAVFGNVTAGTNVVSAMAAAPCTAIPLFLPTGECTPQPYLVITSAVQTQ